MRQSVQHQPESEPRKARDPEDQAGFGNVGKRQVAVDELQGDEGQETEDEVEQEWPSRLGDPKMQLSDARQRGRPRRPFAAGCKLPASFR